MAKEWRICAELKKQQGNIKLKSLFNYDYKDLIKSEDKSIKFRTESAIIDNTVKLIDNKELQERIEALEAVTEEKRS